MQLPPVGLQVGPSGTDVVHFGLASEPRADGLEVRLLARPQARDEGSARKGMGGRDLLPLHGMKCGRDLPSRAVLQQALGVHTGSAGPRHGDDGEAAAVRHGELQGGRRPGYVRLAVCTTARDARAAPQRQLGGSELLGEHVP